jgi:hypothetical protein
MALTRTVNMREKHYEGYDEWNALEEWKKLPKEKVFASML